MLNKIQTYHLYGNRFCGLEHTSKNGKEIIYGTLLKKVRKELNVEKKISVDAIEDLASQLSKNQSIFLVLNNDNVLSKTIESENNEALKLVYKAFPNINIEDFYYEVLSQKNKHFISLCRKEYVKKIIEGYAKNNFFIIAISLANNLSSSIQMYLNANPFFTSNAKISLEANQIKAIEKEEGVFQNYEVEGINISNKSLLSFSGALQLVLKNYSVSTNLNSKKEALLSTFKQTQFFRQFLKLGGLFILGLLVLNFFFFNYYFNKANELKQIYETNVSTKKEMITLNESVSKKQKMVDDLLKSNGSKSSFYSNAVMQILPHSILLSEFNYQPLKKRIKADKAIELEKDIIIVSGTSNNSEVFSSWISQLEQKDWVNNIAIMDYGVSSTNSSIFKIKIGLKNGY